MKRRLLSFFMAVSVVLTSIPGESIYALAAENFEEAVAEGAEEDDALEDEIPLAEGDAFVDGTVEDVAAEDDVLAAGDEGLIMDDGAADELTFPEEDAYFQDDLSGNVQADLPEDIQNEYQDNLPEEFGTEPEEGELPEEAELPEEEILQAETEMISESPEDVYLEEEVIEEGLTEGILEDTSVIMGDGEDLTDAQIVERAQPITPGESVTVDWSESMYHYFTYTPAADEELLFDSRMTDSGDLNTFGRIYRCNEDSDTGEIVLEQVVYNDDMFNYDSGYYQFRIMCSLQADVKYILVASLISGMPEGTSVIGLSVPVIEKMTLNQPVSMELAPGEKRWFTFTTPDTGKQYVLKQSGTGYAPWRGFSNQYSIEQYWNVSNSDDDRVLSSGKTLFYMINNELSTWTGSLQIVEKPDLTALDVSAGKITRYDNILNPLDSPFCVTLHYDDGFSQQVYANGTTRDYSLGGGTYVLFATGKYGDTVYFEFADSDGNLIDCPLTDGYNSLSPLPLGTWKVRAYANVSGSRIVSAWTEFTVTDLQPEQLAAGSAAAYSIAASGKAYYELTAQTEGFYYLSTTPSQATDNYSLYIYSGKKNQTGEIEFTGSYVQLNRYGNSRVVFRLSPDQPVYLRVENRLSDTAQGEFNLSAASPTAYSLEGDYAVSVPGESAGWYTFTAPEDGEYLFRATYKGNEWASYSLCDYRQDSNFPEMYSANGYSSYVSQKMTEGQQILVSLNNTSNAVFTGILSIQKKQTPQAISVSDITIAAPLENMSIDKVSTQITYDGGQTRMVTFNSYSYYDGVTCLWASGPFAENIRLYWYSNGKKVDPPMINPSGNGTRLGSMQLQAELTCDTDGGAVTITSPMAEYKVELAPSAPIELDSQVQFSLADGQDRKLFAFTPVEDGMYEMTADGSSYSVNLYTFDAGENTLSYAGNNWIDDEESAQFKCSAGETAYLVVNGGYVEYPYTADMTIRPYSAVDRTDLDSAVELEDGFSEVARLQYRDKRYYTFTPDESSAGLYEFKVDFTGDPYVYLYKRFGQGTESLQSAWRDYDNPEKTLSLTWQMEAGESYVFELNEDYNGSSKETDYVYFNRKTEQSQREVEEAALSAPSMVDALQLPKVGKEISAKLTYSDGDDETLTDWTSEYVYARYSYIDEFNEPRSNWMYGNVLVARSPSTGRKYAVMLFNEGSIRSLSDSYDSYYEVRKGNGESMKFILCEYVTALNDELKPLDQSATDIRVPAASDYAVISENAGASKIMVSAGAPVIRRLAFDGEGSKQLRLSGTGSDISCNLYTCSDSTQTILSRSDYAYLDAIENPEDARATLRITPQEGSEYYLVLSSSGVSQVEAEIFSDQKVASAELKVSNTLPDFIEGLYVDGYGWSLGECDVQLTFENGDEQSITPLDSGYFSDEYDNWHYIMAFAQEDGVLSRRGSYYNLLDPGTYYAVASDYDVPYPAKGKSFNTDAAGNPQPTPADVSGVMFRVITRESAVAGHSLAAGGSVDLNSQTGYYVGAAYTAASDDQVLVHSSVPLKEIRIYDAQTGETVDAGKLSAQRFSFNTAKNGTYQIFVKPINEGALTLSASVLPKLTRLEIATTLPETLEAQGWGYWINASDFSVTEHFENGDTAVIPLTQKDSYGNGFAAELTGSKYSYTISGTESDELGPDSYEAVAIATGTGLASENKVRFTVVRKEGQSSSAETIELDEIKTVEPGGSFLYEFTPKESGWYSLLKNGNPIAADVTVVKNGNYSGTVDSRFGEGIYALKAGKTYRFESIMAVNDGSFAITRRFPTQLPEGESFSVTLTPGSDSEEMLFTVPASGSYLFSIDTGDWAAAATLTVNEEGGEQQMYASVSDAAQEVPAQLESGEVYCLSAYAQSAFTPGKPITFTIRSGNLSVVSAKLVNVPDASTCPVIMAGTFLDQSGIQVKETYSDGTTGTCAVSGKGRTGVSYTPDFVITGTDGKVLLTVTASDPDVPKMTEELTFMQGVSTIPEISLNEAKKAAYKVGSYWLYRFTPPADEAYAMSMDGSSNARYMTAVYEAATGEDASLDQLKGGTEYLLKISGYYSYGELMQSDTSIAEPTVTVRKSEDTAPAGIRILQGPDTVIGQYNTFQGMKVEVTYANGDKAEHTFQTSAGDDGRGNSFIINRTIMPGQGEKRKFAYTVSLGGYEDVLEAEETDLSTLPSLGTAMSTASGQVEVPAATDLQKWFTFTPQETGTYTLAHTSASGVSSVGFTGIFDAADPAGKYLSVPANMEKDKTYLVLVYARGTSGGTASCWMQSYSGSEGGEAATQKVTYRFVSGTAGKTLPAAVTALRPGDAATGELVLMKNAEADFDTPAVGTEVKDGAGKWIFRGYDQKSGKLDADEVTATGTWIYSEETHTLYYVFESGTDGKDLPAQLKKQAPADETYAKGETAVPTMPSVRTYETTTGTWTFAGYDRTSVTIQSSDETVIGTWNYQDDEFTITYRYYSADENIPLPASIKEPADHKVKKGEAATAQQPEQTRVEDGEYTWIFSGYDSSDLSSLKKVIKDITLHGSWVPVKENYTLTYVFAAQGGKKLPQSVTELLPESVTGLGSGDTVPLTMPAEDEIETEEGIWVFDAYDQSGEQVTITDGDLVVTGTWHLDTTGILAVTYVPVFEIVDDGLARAMTDAEKAEFSGEITTLTKRMPANTGTRAGKKVTPTEPAEKTLDGRHGTWTFAAYTPDSVAEATEDITFTGIWRLTESFADVTWKYEASATSDLSTLGTEITTAYPLPAAAKVRKGDTAAAAQTGSPAKGTTVEDTTGTWTFEGWDKEQVTAGTEPITFTGTWTHKTEKHDITYQAVDGAGQPIKDENVLAKLPADQTDVVKGTPITLTAPSPDEDKVETASGWWTFKEFTVDGTASEGFTVDKADVDVKMVWTYADEEHFVKYLFVSDDPGVELPTEVKAYTSVLETSEEKAVKGTTVMPKDVMPDVTGTKQVTLTDGTIWTFMGYGEDTNGKVMAHDDITFTGTWSRKRVYAITYEFVSATAGKTLPEELAAMAPGQAACYERNTFTVTAPTQKTFETASGNWTFQNYMQESADGEVVTDSVITPTKDTKIVGTWTYADETHKITFAFESATAGTALPADLTAPGSIEALKGFEVALPAPAAGDIHKTADGVWTFSGWFVNEAAVTKVTIGKTDIDVTGRWTFESSAQAAENAASVIADEASTPEEVLTALEKTDSEALAAEVSGDGTDAAAAIGAVQELADALDGKFEGKQISTGGQDGGAAATATVQAAEAGEGTMIINQAEKVRADVDGAAATVAQFIREADAATAAKINGQKLKTEVVVKVKEEKLDLVTIDLSLSIVDGSGHTVKEDVEPVSPVSVTLTLPERFADKDFKLVHVKDDGTQENVAFTRDSASENIITFTATSFSEYKLTDIVCKEGEHHIEKVTDDGSVDYYRCKECSAKFSDAAGTKPLADSDLQAMNTAVTAIAALPDNAGYAQIDQVKAAEKAYDKLTAEQKQLLDELAAATGDQATKNALQKLSDATAKVASDVAEKMNQLDPAKGLAGEDAVKAAREAYDKLSDAQKAKVSQAALAKLTAAEQAVKDEKDDADAAKAAVEALPANAGVADEAKVAAAQAALDDLTPAQKAYLGGDAAVNALKAKVSTAQAQVAQAKQDAADAANNPTTPSEPAAPAAPAETPFLDVKVGEYNVANQTLVLKTKQKYNMITVDKLASEGVTVTSSSDKDVKAVLSGNTIRLTAGKKPAKKAVTITVTTTNSKMTVTFKVKVQKKKVVAKKAINFKKKLNLKVGEKADLKVYIMPITTPDKVKFTSSAKKIVAVDKRTGVMTAKKAGKAVITLKVGTKTFKCKVTVK